MHSPFLAKRRRGGRARTSTHLRRLCFEALDSRLTLSVSVAGVSPVAPGGTLTLDVTWSGAETQGNCGGTWVFVSEAGPNRITMNGLAWPGNTGVNPADLVPPLTPPANGGVRVDLPDVESGSATFVFENVGYFCHPKRVDEAN
jgi:hypothetical protein